MKLKVYYRITREGDMFLPEYRYQFLPLWYPVLHSNEFHEGHCFSWIIRVSTYEEALKSCQDHKLLRKKALERRKEKPKKEKHYLGQL